MIEVRYLQAAIVLAEELSYTVAAQRLCITQSTLSRQIAELESKIGLSLFMRNRKRVDLTDPGRVFVEESREAVWHSTRAVELARATSIGADCVLIVGRSPYTDQQLISTALSVRLPLYPKLQIRFRSEFSCELAQHVLTSEIDLAFVTCPPQTPRLSTVEVVRAPFYIAMPEQHPLSKKKSLTLRDMADTCWILFAQQAHPPLYQAIMHRIEEEGIQLKAVHHIVTCDEALHLVGENMGLAFLTKASALRRATPEIAVRPLVDETLVLDTHLAVRADNQSRLASEFVRAFMKRTTQIEESKATDE